MKKKLLVSVLATSIVTLALAGCGDNRKTTETETAASTEQVSEETATAAESVEADAASETSENTDATELAEGEYTIGISQFAEHGSLDNCREGFLAGLAEEGIVEGENLTVEFQNAEADTGIASQISDSFVSAGVDLICAIATPSAMSAYNSAMNTDIPVIYTAVSDPVGAELAGSDGMPLGNITGTSDALAVTEQLEMIRAMLPDATKIGIIYTTSETNSVSTIAQYKEYAADYGFEIVETGINTLADLDMAASDMASKVDCINNLTDNTVVSGLQTVIKYATEAGIPVFGSEVEQVKAGCVASMGLDYYQLGIQTGKMAAAVLKGEKSASEMAFEVIDEPSLYVNTAAAEKINMEISEETLGSAAEVYDTITVE
ncbi:MAG: ABC transporter substrate-binding protein [Butyrivibrio sp.]|nr:ABC transporter substrate-binding protein [Butyrivibrio sp.]